MAGASSSTAVVTSPRWGAQALTWSGGNPCSLVVPHSRAEPEPNHLLRLRDAAVLPPGVAQLHCRQPLRCPVCHWALSAHTWGPPRPQGASNVRCALCNNVTPVPPAGTEMAQLECGGCRTLLMYIRGASSVQCSVCNTVNLAMQGAYPRAPCARGHQSERAPDSWVLLAPVSTANQIAHVHCGGCGITLMCVPCLQHCACCLL